MKKRSKPCYECYEGICEETIEDFSLDPEDPSAPIVPSVKILKCNKCGEASLSMESFEYVGKYLSDLENRQRHSRNFESQIFNKKVSFMKYYAGIGNREIPDEYTGVIKKIAEHLRKKGYILRSGGSQGSDSLFESQAGDRKEIIIPNNWFNGRSESENVFVFNEENDFYWEYFKIAQECHPIFCNLKPYVKRLIVRNIAQIMGFSEKKYVDFVVCYTNDGAETTKECTENTGGTAVGIKCACLLEIPVFNIKNASSVERLREFLKKNS